MNMWLRIVQLAYRPHVIRVSVLAATLVLGVVWGAHHVNGVIWGD